VLLCINCSIRERLSGGVGVAGVDGAEGEGMGEGIKFGGLGWAGVAGCCIVVIVGGFSTVGSGWSGVSVILVLMLGGIRHSVRCCSGCAEACWRQ